MPLSHRIISTLSLLTTKLWWYEFTAAQHLQVDNEVNHNVLINIQVCYYLAVVLLLTNHFNRRFLFNIR